MSALTPRLLPLVAALALLAAAGCGGSHVHSGRVFEPNLISSEQVNRYPEHSPARAALELVRAIQFNAPGAAARIFAPEWKVRPEQLATAFKQVAPIASTAGAPKILAVRQHGNDAVVVASFARITLRLPWRRMNGDWRLLPIRDLRALRGLAS